MKKYYDLAEQIVRRYENDSEVKRVVDSSPEPYRALVYETGIVPNPHEIDGTVEYERIVDALEQRF